jgi:hypothetical protein
MVNWARSDCAAANRLNERLGDGLSQHRPIGSIIGLAQAVKMFEDSFPLWNWNAAASSPMKSRRGDCPHKLPIRWLIRLGCKR